MKFGVPIAIGRSLETAGPHDRKTASRNEVKIPPQREPKTKDKKR